ncbi:MAG: GNAT family N-acetyltransferase [Mucilaginibacter sp.]
MRYFPAEVSPFTGLVQNTSENLQVLYNTVPYTGPFGLISPVAMQLPAAWNVLREIKVLQMVCTGAASKQADAGLQAVPLSEQHVPAMLELTQLTNPGPFTRRTIELGHYEGVFDGERLVAMAGQRMHPVPYAEISAVCTHPDYLGRGYAAGLILRQVERIRAASGIPFLHVLTGNSRAIRLYESLGFEGRKELFFYIMVKGDN